MDTLLLHRPAAQNTNSPIDLTGNDEDDDLRKAMQASLESENDRQKRQQEYGPLNRGSGGGNAVSWMQARARIRSNDDVADAGPPTPVHLTHLALTVPCSHPGTRRGTTHARH